MSIEALYLWWGEDASDNEIWTWQQLKKTENMKGASIVEVHSRDDMEQEHIRLVAAGWQLMSTGSGSLVRMSGYQRTVRSPD